MDYTIDLNNNYTRFNNLQSKELKNKLEKLYNNENIIISNSGLHANSIILNYFYKNYNIIYPKQLYFENINLIKYLSNTIYEFDILDDLSLINILNNISNKNNILFIESCSNPFGYIFNYNIIKEIKKIVPNLKIICDNTWLSIEIFNPLLLDIDIVTKSLTKYYSGNTSILGACIIKDFNIFNNIENYIKYTGIHNSINNITIINNSLDYMKIRLKKLNILSKKIIKYLIQNNINVIHPYLLTHISHKLVLQYFNINLYTSTFLIEINKSIEDINILLSTLDCVTVSFGGSLTKIDKNIFFENNKNYIRLSIGYNDTYDNLKLKINKIINYL